MNKFKKELNFSKKFNSCEGIEISLSSEEIKNQTLEFIWFFNCTNNVKFLIENNYFEHVGILYKKYCDEIDKLIKYYELGELISESEYFQAWFKNWKKLEKFTQEEFLNKLYKDIEFCSFWGDFGVSDSSEFRNWGIQITFDAEDRGRIAQNGKDQFRELLNSLTNDPENGNHLISYYNIINKEDRLFKSNLIYNKFFCEPLTYKERIDWFILNHYETGMEYEILFESFKDKNLDFLKWGESTVYIPKYKLNVIADYNVIENEKFLEKQLVFNYLLLFYLCRLLNMLPNDVIINSIYRIKHKYKKPLSYKYKAKLTKTNFQSFDLDPEEYKLELC